MRITSDLFVAQLMRRVFGDGGFAAVARKGAEAAGAIFVLARARDGTLRLYAPAAAGYSGEDQGRRFMLEGLRDEDALAARLEKEKRFDPDFWLVEIETDRPSDFLEIAAE